MTLVIAISSPETIWLLVDRRLTRAGRPVKDDACKILELGALPHDVALIGYAGLGATEGGIEPSTWMSNTLRGHHGLALEQYLAILADAMKRRFPSHMGADLLSHLFVAPAFVNGKPRLYGVGIALSPDLRQSQSMSTYFVVGKPEPTNRSVPTVRLSGSGAFTLRDCNKFKDLRWLYRIKRLVRQSAHRQLKPADVAAYLAKLNYQVSRSDTSVGPRCFVAWRNKEKGIHAKSGGGSGGQLSYTNGEQDRSFGGIPHIFNGQDIAAMVKVVFSHHLTAVAALKPGEPYPEFDKDSIDAALAKLPVTPDDGLD